jgi:hypothetical protein
MHYAYHVIAFIGVVCFAFVSLVVLERVLG